MIKYNCRIVDTATEGRKGDTENSSLIQATLEARGSLNLSLKRDVELLIDEFTNEGMRQLPKTLEFGT